MRIAVLITAAVLLLSACSGSKETVDAPEKGPKGELSSREQYKADYMFMEGNRERVLGNWETAAEFYGACLEVDEDNHAAMYELSLCLNKMGLVKESIGFAALAVKNDPENEWYKVRHANILLESGDAEGAAKAFESLIDLNPEQDEYYFDWAYALLLNDDFEGAIKAYDEVEKIIGKFPELSFQKHNIYQQIGKKDAALKELEKLVEEHPDNLKAWNMIADSYKAEGNTAKAFETYEKIIQLDPDNAIVHLSLADYYEDQGDRAKSHDELRKAFASPKMSAESMSSVLQSYYPATNDNEELKTFCLELGKVMIERYPEDTQANIVYGNYLYRENQLEEARKHYRTASEGELVLPSLWQQICSIDAELTDWKSLEEDSEGALELFPTQPGFYLYAGTAKRQNGDLEGAQEMLETGKEFVIENDALLAQFYADLGTIYNSTKDYEASDNAFEKSLQKDGSSAYVMNNYSYYLALRNFNLPRALDLAQKANQLSPGQPSFMDTYGYVLFVSERYEEAAEWFKKAMDAGGKESGVIVEHYGDALFKLGRIDEAVQAWKDAKLTGSASGRIDDKIANKQLHD